MNQEHPTVLTVTQLNNQVKSILETRFKQLWKEGEVSNPKTYPSGHIYFTLKDSMSEISAVQFSGSRRVGSMDITHGMKVVAYGSPTVYLRGGRYQFIVDTLYPSGKGELWLAYEQLKQRLESEGLFDQNRKRPIPSFPTCIGVVTSENGAVLRDIIHVITRRAPHVEILVKPARVQGEGAAREIESGIIELNSYGRPDIIIIARGGGSLEDLWCFNDEQLAYTIFRSEIPVISAVGHETDFTISDFVADLRAPTPSAAAELAVPVRKDWLQSLDEIEIRMKETVLHQIDIRRQDLDRKQERYAFHKPGMIIKSLKERFESLMDRLNSAHQNRIQVKSTQLDKFVHQLQLHSPLNILERMSSNLMNLKQQLNTMTHQKIMDRRSDVEHLTNILIKLNPDNILQRGYSLVKTTDGDLVKTSRDVVVNEIVSVLLSKGELTAQITETHHGKKD